MNFIPQSPGEVKSIIEAVNLETLTRFKYLKGERALCEYPFEVNEKCFKDLGEVLDMALWNPADPDQEVIFTEKPYPTIYWERKPRTGEVKPIHVDWLRARALAESQPRRIEHADENEPAQGRSNVVHLPALERRPDRHDRPPRDVLKYHKAAQIGETWQRLLKVMYEKSWYGPLSDVGGYAGKSRKLGRYYTQGNAELQRSTGMCSKTVTRYLIKMKAKKIILQHKRGWPGEKCSIWELPFSLEHFFAWKRRHQK